MKPPKSVLLVLDWLVEQQATTLKGMKVARIRIGYGRHSPNERAWDYRKREQLIADGVPPRKLVQLPSQERDGLAEECGVHRRTAIRAAKWLTQRRLVHIVHHFGTHPVRDQYGTVHEVGRGARLPGGEGAAGEWLPGAAPEPQPEPEPEPEPEGPVPGRGSLGELARRELGPRPTRARAP